MSQHRRTNNQNEGVPHERNRMLRYMSASATPISRSGNNQRVYDLNLHPRQEIVHNNIIPTSVLRDVGSFSSGSIPPLGINPRQEIVHNNIIPISILRDVGSFLNGSIPPLGINPRQEIVHNNIIPTNVLRDVGSFSNGSVPPLGINPHSPTSSAHGRRLFDPNGPEYQMGNSTGTRDTRRLLIKRRSFENSSSREYEVGESSTRQRVHPFENNPNNNLSMSSTPFGHVNSSSNFNLGHGISHNNFQSYEQGGSSSNSLIGMGSWAPRVDLMIGSYQNPSTNFVYSIQHLNAPSSLYIHNTVNIHQYVTISPRSHFVTPSPPNVQASSSSFNPLPSYAQQNQLLPMFGNHTSEQNELFSATARVGENLEHILMSTSPQLRTERTRLRDQIYRVQQEQLNSGFVPADDVIITRYSRALDILDAQERLDQLNSEAWRYVLEMGLREEEIMAYIRQEFFHSTSIEEQHETCSICQEDFLDGEHIGILNCGHKYHIACIKQWLLRKNMCPVCKQRALNVED